MGELLVSDKKIWEHHLNKAQQAGYVGPSSVTFEEMKRFVDERRYQIEFAPEGNLRVEFHAFDELLPILGQRTWSVLLAPPSGPALVSSDHPVALTWKDANKRGPRGYGLKTTEVFLPLGPLVGFYGVYEQPLRPVVTMKPRQVAIMNARVTFGADKHVFSSESAFFVWYKGQVREVDCGSNLGVQRTRR